jgi:hypothetical protein
MNKNTMELLQLEVSDWQEKTFPNATSRSAYCHLIEEIVELGITLGLSFPEIAGVVMKSKDAKAGDVGKELADCQMLIFCVSSTEGKNLYEQTVEKFEVCKTRIWGEPDENGVVKHIKEQ